MTLREVIAAAAAVGKPPLTNVQFNQRFAALNAGLDQAAARNLPLRLANRVDCGRFGRLRTHLNASAVTIDFLPAVQMPSAIRH
ncbi:MAG TPA: hypothetical protein VJ853_00545 [Thermoanaerobaculia bacterium]|nr:hypothetical protein [Thermoanaerobaculia bacterium]